MKNLKKKNDGFCKMIMMGFLCIMPGFLVLAGIIYKQTQFNINCESYLKMAADASSVKIARERLGKAIQYLEDNKMTEGSTSVLWSTPTQDVGSWYKNLKEAEIHLYEISENASEADISTTLSRLRETLLDHGSEGDSVTVPLMLALFPNNVEWIVGVVVSILLLCYGMYWFVMKA